MTQSSHNAASVGFMMESQNIHKINKIIFGIIAEISILYQFILNVKFYKNLIINL